jgi:hypothetical protein
MSEDFPKIPEGVARWEDDQPVLVLRPVNRDMTIALAKIAVAHDSDEALRQAVGGGPLTFMGFLMQRDGVMMAVDENGENPVPIDSGDVLGDPGMLIKPD